MRWRLSLHGALAAVVALVALATGSAGCGGAAAPALAPGGAAPNVSFALADGTAISAEQARGDVVVLAFFTIWCPASAELLRAMDSVAGRGKPPAGVRVLAVDEGDTPADVAAFVANLGVHLDLAYDKSGAAATQLGLPTIPSVIVIDREGIVRHVHAGYHGEADRVALAGELAALASQSAVPAP